MCNWLKGQGTVKILKLKVNSAFKLYFESATRFAFMRSNLKDVRQQLKKYNVTRAEF